MERINTAIAQYQQRIGKYDKQVWEQSVEQEVLKRLRNVPRKTAKVNPDLIDVDLFGGSAFCRPKPQYGWIAVSRRAVLRVVFLPLYYRWWRQSTFGWMFALLCILYVLQVASFIVRFTDSSENSETLSVAHIASPCIMMFLLTLVHSQIMTAYETSHSQYSQLKAKNKRTKARGKRKSKTSAGSGLESLGSQDKGASLNQENVDCNDSSRPLENVERLSETVDGSRLKPDKSRRSMTDSECRHSASSARTASFEKTSAWLLKQNPTHCSSAGSSKATLSSRKSSIETSKVDIPKSTTVYLSRSLPALSSLTPVSNNSEDLAVSTLTMVAEGSTCDKANSTAESLCHPSTTNSRCSAGQKARQLRFCCALPERHASRKVKSAECDDLPVKEYISLDSQNHPSAASLDDTTVDELSVLDDEASIANSNTSLSDTCNSSFKSSTEDLTSERGRGRGVAAYDGDDKGILLTLPHHHHHDHHLSAHQPFGLRHRKRESHESSQAHASQVTVTQSIRTSETLTTSVVSDSIVQLTSDPVTADVSGLPQSAVETSMSVNSPHKEMPSSDDESHQMLQVSPSKARSLRHQRKQSSLRCVRSSDKCPCHSSPVDATTKDRGSRADGRRSKVRIVDVRQLESTGISSGESDHLESGTGRHSNTKTVISSKNYLHRVLCHQPLDQRTSTDVATSEWEDTVNTEITSGSVSETSSQATSTHSDLSAKDILGNMAEPAGQSIQHVSSVMNNLASNSDRVSCMIWEPNAVHKVDLTVLDIGWTIMQKVDKIPETCDYLVLGIVFSVLIMFTPTIYRIYHSSQVESLNYQELAEVGTIAKLAFGHNWRQIVVLLNGMTQRLCLSLISFFLLSVAERTFKQRLLYAKNFCYLTSSRRAKKYELPHFRLNKVRNIKTWLSLRSFLKKRGPQRSVESIVSASFLLAVVLVSILCIELLQDYGTFLDHLGNWELVIWCLCLGVYLLRFITLGSKINKKYRNFSVLITEQINLYLHMEQKPHKKEELKVANSVLKLAEDLLKELESPFKISGLSANPFLYNITKVVVLSAFSAVLTELLGFKLKLYKIKIRA